MSADEQPPPPTSAELYLVRWRTRSIAGGIYGFVVGLSARSLERSLHRLRRPRAG